MLSEARNPITPRLCLAGLGRGGGTLHGKGRQAAKGWWIWMRGARREGQGSREGFPLGWIAPCLPTRTRKVPDPVLALSAALERGRGCRCLWASWEHKSMHGAGAWDPESKGGQAPTPVKDPASGRKLSWISRSIGSSSLKESIPGRAGPGPTCSPKR